MAADCFGNPTPYPPSISDDFHSIEVFRPIPVSQRMEYHYARTDAMIGQGTNERAWSLYNAMLDELSKPMVF